jgi:hypothetical protein
MSMQPCPFCGHQWQGQHNGFHREARILPMTCHGELNGFQPSSAGPDDFFDRVMNRVVGTLLVVSTAVLVVLQIRPPL